MTTKHNHEANFGKKVTGCPRCEELKAGAKPITWRLGGTNGGYYHVVNGQLVEHKAV